MRIITKVSGKIEGLSDKTLKLYHMYLDDFFILSFILYQNEKTFPQKLLTRKLRTFDKYFARLHPFLLSVTLKKPPYCEKTEQKL